jgi:hypothetical protein
MSRFTAFFRLSAVVGLCLASAPLQAQQYDPDAPCGRDENGLAYSCNQDASANIEASCLTLADPTYCLPYHQRACQIQGFAVACQLYSIGANCQGGDPNQCNFYLTILAANRDCQLNGNQSACGWLQQQGY